MRYQLIILFSFLVASLSFAQDVRLSIQTGHASAINEIAYNSDKSLLASGSADNNVAIWHIESSKQFANLRGHENVVTGVAFDPSKNILYSSSLDSTVIIWDVIQAEKIDQIKFDFPIGAMAIHPDGRSLAIAGEYLCTYTLSDRKKKCYDLSSQYLFSALAYSTSGKYLSVGGNKDKSTYVLDLSSNEKVGQFQANSNDLVFDSEDRYVYAATENGGIIRYEFQTHKTEGVTNKSEWNSFNSVSISEKYLIGGTDKAEIVVFERNKYKKQVILKAHLQAVNDLIIDEKSNRLLSAGADKRIIEWDLAQHEIIQSLHSNIYRINEIEFSQNEEDIIIGFSNGFVRRTNLLTNSSVANRAKLGQLQIQGGWEFLLNSFEQIDNEVVEFNLLLLRKSVMLDGAYDHVRDVKMSWNSLYNEIQLSEIGSGSRKISTYEKALRNDIILPLTHFMNDENLKYSSKNFNALIKENELIVIDKNGGTNDTLQIKLSHSDRVTSVAINEKYGFVATAGWDGMVKFWDIKNGELLSTFGAFGASDFVYLRPDNYYYASKGALDNIGFAIEDQLYSFDQFDLIFNRPDLVFKMLPYVSNETVENYERAYKKRLAKLGVDENSLKITTQLPTLEVTNQTGTVTSSGIVNIEITAEDELTNLQSYHILVNGVPILTREGKELDSSYAQIKEKITINPGKNLIQTYVTNDKGVSSFKKSFTVISTQSNVKSDLYLIALGCSKYQQSQFNLNYAEKDANDMVNFFSKSTLFNEVHSTKLVNEQLTKQNLNRIEEFVSRAKENDVVLLFIAGHGVLDADLNYYIASHDMDFQQPQEKGISIEFFDDLLDHSKCLKKLMFIDACHSGEIDKSEVTVDTNSVENKDSDLVFRTVGNTVKNINDFNSFELSKIAFADIRKSNGSIVISSAGGGEFAMEGDNWSNGVFTYSLLKGLKDYEADLNQDNKIMISELHTYLIQSVNRITKGKQTPTSRVENIKNDFRIQ